MLRIGYAVLALAGTALLHGCATERIQSPHADAATTIRLVVPPAPATVGARLAVAVQTDDRGASLAGVQGAVRYDQHRLRFAGQLQEDGVYTLARDDVAPGTLRFMTFAPRRIPARMVVFAFEVLAADYARGLRLEMQQAVAASGGVVTLAVETAPARATGLPSVAAARRLALADWARELTRTGDRQLVARFSPGAGLVYGDAYLDGTINVIDALACANVAVGQLSLITDAAYDNVIAANVEPANLPGLGEAGDAQPPGREPGGRFAIDVLDALAIVRAALGEPSQVVGHAIPGRNVAPGHAVLTGSIGADRTLAADTVYDLVGLVTLTDSITVTIQPGTRIQSASSAQGELIVEPGSKLMAIGTRLQPIVFGCADAVPMPGCWRGIHLHGSALLNNTDFGGGNGVGCPQKSQADGGGRYGGCLEFDDSGQLRYVRIEYAGAPAPGGEPLPALSLLGVGSGTVVDTVQVHRSSGDGIFVSGGAVDLRAVLVTGAVGSGIRWNDGWVGRGQNLIVQSGMSAGPGLWGRNADALPTSRKLTYPRLYNVTVIGAGPGGGPGVLLERGTGVLLSNAVILRAGGAGLQINGAESCALAAAGDSLDVRESVFFQSPEDFSIDADCIDEAAYALEPGRGNRVIDPGLAAPFLTATPDFRPRQTSPASAGPTPPTTGFFDPALAYRGGAPVESAVVPWFTGWTAGW